MERSEEALFKCSFEEGEEEKEEEGDYVLNTAMELHRLALFLR